MLIILLVLLLLSLLLFYCTHYTNTKEGIDDIDTVNDALSNNSVFLSMKTSTNIDNISSNLKKFGNIKNMALQSQADLAVLNDDVNNLETIEKILPNNTTGIAALTKQVNDLADLEQEATNLSAIIKHNTTLMNKVGSSIKKRALNIAAPGQNVDPPPNPAGRGSDWPPPGGSPPTLHVGIPPITL